MRILINAHPRISPFTFDIHREFLINTIHKQLSNKIMKTLDLQSCSVHELLCSVRTFLKTNEERFSDETYSKIKWWFCGSVTNWVHHRLLRHYLGAPQTLERLLIKIQLFVDIQCSESRKNVNLKSVPRYSVLSTCRVG